MKRHHDYNSYQMSWIKHRLLHFCWFINNFNEYILNLQIASQNYRWTTKKAESLFLTFIFYQEVSRCSSLYSFCCTFHIWSYNSSFFLHFLCFSPPRLLSINIHTFHECIFIYQRNLYDMKFCVNLKKWRNNLVIVS